MFGFFTAVTELFEIDAMIKRNNKMSSDHKNLMNSTDSPIQKIIYVTNWVKNKRKNPDKSLYFKFWNVIWYVISRVPI